MYTDDKEQLTRVKQQENIHKKKKKTHLRPWAFWSLFLLFATMFIVNIIIIYNWSKDNKEIKNIEKEIEEIAKVKEESTEGTLINPPESKDSDYWYYIKMPFYSVDFSILKEKNSDTVGFINMKNTNINYPIVQTSNNEYYLTHAFDKSNNSAGWVFMDYRNNFNFTDDNTIIYGHGRLNKTVFGSLKDSLTETWQKNKDNYIISISTPERNLNYQIFSIYTIESETYYITPEFSNKEEKIKWLNTMKERNTSLADVSVNENDFVITLSTCENNQGGRIVVHAKLIKEQILN